MLYEEKYDSDFKTDIKKNFTNSTQRNKRDTGNLDDNVGESESQPFTDYTP